MKLGSTISNLHGMCAALLLNWNQVANSENHKLRKKNTRIESVGRQEGQAGSATSMDLEIALRWIIFCTWRPQEFCNIACQNDLLSSIFCLKIFMSFYVPYNKIEKCWNKIEISEVSPSPATVPASHADLDWLLLMLILYPLLTKQQPGTIQVKSLKFSLRNPSCCLQISRNIWKINTIKLELSTWDLCIALG